MLMVRTASATPPPVARAQDTTQSHAQPRIEGRERRRVAVFEIAKPPAQDPVHVVNDDRQALPVSPPRLVPQRVFERRQTLRPRPAVAALEVIAQEVKALDRKSVV